MPVRHIAVFRRILSLLCELAEVLTTGRDILRPVLERDDGVHKTLVRLQLKCDRPAYKAGVAGPTCAGKTTFLNSLIGREFLPPDAVANTAVCTTVVHDTSCEDGALFEVHSGADGATRQLVARGREDIFSCIKRANDDLKGLGPQADAVDTKSFELRVPLLGLNEWNELKVPPDMELAFTDSPGKSVDFHAFDAAAEESEREVDHIIFLIAGDNGEHQTEVRQALEHFADARRRRDLFAESHRFLVVVNKCEKFNDFDRQFAAHNDAVRRMLSALNLNPVTVPVIAASTVCWSSAMCLLHPRESECDHESALGALISTRVPGVPKDNLQELLVLLRSWPNLSEDAMRVITDDVKAVLRRDNVGGFAITRYLLNSFAAKLEVAIPRAVKGTMLTTVRQLQMSIDGEMGFVDGVVARLNAELSIANEKRRSLMQRCESAMSVFGAQYKAVAVERHAEFQRMVASVRAVVLALMTNQPVVAELQHHASAVAPEVRQLLLRSQVEHSLVTRGARDSVEPRIRAELRPRLQSLVDAADLAVAAMLNSARRIVEAKLADDAHSCMQAATQTCLLPEPDAAVLRLRWRCAPATQRVQPDPAAVSDADVPLEAKENLTSVTFNFPFIGPRSASVVQTATTVIPERWRGAAVDALRWDLIDRFEMEGMERRLAYAVAPDGAATQYLSELRLKQDRALTEDSDRLTRELNVPLRTTHVLREQGRILNLIQDELKALDV